MQSLLHRYALPIFPRHEAWYSFTAESTETVYREWLVLCRYLGHSERETNRFPNMLFFRFFREFINAKILFGLFILLYVYLYFTFRGCTGCVAQWLAHPTLKRFTSLGVGSSPTVSHSKGLKQAFHGTWFQSTQL